VVPDLLIHDLDLVIRLFGVQPSAVAAAGWRPAGGEWDEVVDCTLRFGSQGVAALSVDRVGQRKVRTLSLSTETQLIELDLMRQDLTVYRHIDHELLGQRTGYRAQTVVEIPFVKQAGEPLARQLAHFLALVAGTANVEDERATLLAPHAWATEVEQQCAAATS
jgi:predicted dehydrogenase